ncbi:MAG: transcriptional repressor [Oscillospiraceae bacterium]|nr:transcriptional repressor [Oscillospiraceae bacterium]
MTQRFSQQRERIYEAVCASKEHPTAQMIYDTLRPELPRLSLGTVYRNLHQMAQEGRLREMEGAVARFDAVLEPHTHVRCVRCGRVADLALPYDAALDSAAAESGWRIADHSLTFTGICPACAGDRSNLKGETIWN